MEENLISPTFLENYLFSHYEDCKRKHITIYRATLDE
jgi:hypothetical protein